MFGLYALVWYLLTQTAWGRHVYAIGNNRLAARLGRYSGAEQTALGLCFRCFSVWDWRLARARAHPQRGPECVAER